MYETRGAFGRLAKIKIRAVQFLHIRQDTGTEIPGNYKKRKKKCTTNVEHKGVTFFFQVYRNGSIHRRFFFPLNVKSILFLLQVKKKKKFVENKISVKA